MGTGQQGHLPAEHAFFPFSPAWMRNWLIKALLIKELSCLLKLCGSPSLKKIIIIFFDKNLMYHNQSMTVISVATIFILK